MTSIRAACLFLGVTIAGGVSGFAQLKAVSVEQLPLDPSHAWAMPQWSPDGQSVYFTQAGFNGIWAYSTATRTTRQVSAVSGSGYGFTVAANGSVVLSNSSDGEADGASLRGPEGNAIAVRIHGQTSILDPLAGGRYIWPSLSPDGSRLAAYDMERGTFVFDLAGKTTVRLGRRDAAVWTRDGKWLVYMADKDDGQRILGSEIAFVSPDGKFAGRLTSTDTLTEMFPRCSPTGNKIVCSTQEGGIVIITYVDDGR